MAYNVKCSNRILTNIDMDKRNEITEQVLSKTTIELDNKGEPRYVLSQSKLDGLIDSLVKSDLLHSVSNSDNKYCEDCGDYVKDGCDNKDCKDFKGCC